MNSLREFRTNAGYSTQKKLAEILGVEPATVSRWETGERRPDISLIPELARIFNTSEGLVVKAINSANTKNGQKGGILCQEHSSEN